MHVTLTCWLALVLNKTRFAALGWTYLGLIWIGSILLGWHWGLGGIAGGLGMLVLWKLAPLFFFVQPAQPVVPEPALAGVRCFAEEAAGG
jgi:hypothetical protein